MSVLRRFVSLGFVLTLLVVAQTFAQDNERDLKKVNFSYSANPPARISKSIKKPKKTDEAEIIATDEQENASIKPENDQNPRADLNKSEGPANISLAAKTGKMIRKAERKTLSPTEYYRVGVGDVLYINLQDTTAKYYTVLVDGTIDYPLAGKMVSVIELTTDEIEDLLREKITLYENPQVSVKVRDYASHLIRVEGLARTGDHFLRREAMPLVVVKTMVGVDPKAKKVTIERKGSAPATFPLSTSAADEFLIQNGDILRFEAEPEKAETPVGQPSGFFFYGEKICAGGKKNYHAGLTLIQAIFDACGGVNDKLKVVNILRKTESGEYITQKYDIKDILRGKQGDPELRPGDMLDTGN